MVYADVVAWPLIAFSVVAVIALIVVLVVIVAAITALLIRLFMKQKKGNR